VFDREYIEAPILSASIAYATTTSDEDINALFVDDIRYMITARSTKGFTIRLNKEATGDVSLNWIALAIVNSKEFTSKTPEFVPPVEVEEAVLHSALEATELSTTTESVLEIASSTVEVEVSDPVIVVEEESTLSLPVLESIQEEVVDPPPSVDEVSSTEIETKILPSDE